MQAEALNLPEEFANKWRGKKIELVEDGDSIVISPVVFSPEAMLGMLKSDGHEVERHLARKREDKKYELALERRRRRERGYDD
jgi:virulence-associated protein VagC